MRRKWILLLILIMLSMTFSLMFKSENLFQRAIVIGMGIEKVNEKYQISIEYMKEEKYIIHKSTGRNFKEAIAEIEKEIGLKVSLSQIIAIIVQKNQSVLTILEEISKEKSLSTNTIIVSTDHPSEFLQSEIEAKDSVSNLLCDVLNKREEKVVIKDILISIKTKRPIKIIGLNIQDKSLFKDEDFILKFD